MTNQGVRATLGDRERLPSMRIGELSELVGLDAPTIRFYEGKGVLPQPARSAAGYRLYTEVAADRLRFIKQARALGLGLREIREIRVARDAVSPPCAYVRRLLTLQVEQTREQLRDLRTLLAELERLEQLSQHLPLEPDPDEMCICHAIECSELDSAKTSR